VTIGLPLTKTNLDNIMGMEIGAVWNSLDVIRVRLLWLNDAAHNTTFMGTLGYTGPEDTTIRAAYTDLDSLRQIAHATGAKGVATIGQAAAANDFFFSAKGLGGPNWYG